MSGAEFAKRDADELLVEASEVGILRQLVRGEVVVPGDVAYDQARRVWNGMG